MNRLKQLRKKYNYKQKDVAKILNISQQMYSKIENGKNEITLDNLNKLAEYYNTSTDFILGRTNSMNPYPKN